MKLARFLCLLMGCIGIPERVSSQEPVAHGYFFASPSPGSDTVRGIARYVRCGDTLEVSLARPPALVILARIGKDSTGTVQPPIWRNVRKASRLGGGTRISFLGIGPAFVNEGDSGEVRLEFDSVGSLRGRGFVWASPDPGFTDLPPERARFLLHFAFHATQVPRANNTEFFGTACPRGN
jgi:hypothetical protein